MDAPSHLLPGCPLGTFPGANTPSTAETTPSASSRPHVATRPLSHRAVAVRGRRERLAPTRRRDDGSLRRLARAARSSRTGISTTDPVDPEPLVNKLLPDLGALGAARLDSDQPRIPPGTQHSPTTALPRSQPSVGGPGEPPAAQPAQPAAPTGSPIPRQRRSNHRPTGHIFAIRPARPARQASRPTGTHRPHRTARSGRTAGSSGGGGNLRRPLS